MMATFTGKSSGYLVGKDSHYVVNQLWYEVLNPLGLPSDLVRVMDALNAVEKWLGISQTTWTSTLGNPRGAKHPNYSVRIGGDSSNLGTFREAIDRLREEGEVDAWTWVFAPTKDELFHSRRLCVSSLTVFEYFLAIGRIVGTGIAGDIGRSTVGFIHQPYWTDPTTGVCDDKYQVGASSPRDFALALPLESQWPAVALYEFRNDWSTYGGFNHEFRIQRPGTEDFSTNYTPDINEPLTNGISESETLTDVGLACSSEGRGPGAGKASLYIEIFRQNGDTDFKEGLEAIESAHEDKWEYVYRDESTDDGQQLDLGSIQQTSDVSMIVGVVAAQGPATSTYKYVSPGEDYLIYDGDFEVVVTRSGVDNPDAYVEGPGGFDLTERWMPPFFGFGNDVLIHAAIAGQVNLNSPVWQHNEANRGAFAGVVFPDPAPEAFHFNLFEPGAAYPYRQEGTHVGSGDWRTSEKSPYDGAGYPYDSDDPDDELDPEDAFKIIMDNLSGANGAGVFNPATQNPKKHFWCWCEGFVQTPDLASTLRPGSTGSSYDGLPSSLVGTWTQAKQPASTPNSIGPWVAEFAQQKRAAAAGFGSIFAQRAAAMNFPTINSASSKWLVWNSYGTDGDSPFEEVVTRF